MAIETDWARGYLEQAREDLKAVQALSDGSGNTKADPSVVCMLLQMVFEKISKAALLQLSKAKVEDLKGSHKAASSFLTILKKNRRLLAEFEPNNPQAVVHLIPCVKELEQAHPQIARGIHPQLEYPWPNPATGEIQWPAKHLPIANRMRNPRDRILGSLIKLASMLVNRLEKVAGRVGC